LKCAPTRLIGVPCVQTPRLEHLVEKTERSAVEIGRRRDLVARAQEGGEDRRRSSQSRREGEPAFAPFQSGKACLQRSPRRIAAARVFVPLVLADCRLSVSRSRVDGDDRGPCGRVRVLAGVNGTGGETGFLI